MKKYIKCVKLEKDSIRVNGSTVFVRVPTSSKDEPLHRRLPEDQFSAMCLVEVRRASTPKSEEELSSEVKPSGELTGLRQRGKPSLQDVLVARRQYLRFLILQPKKRSLVHPETISRRVTTRSMTNSLPRSSGRPATVSVLGSTRVTSTATITPQRCSRQADKPYREALLQRIPLLPVSGSTVTSSTVGGQTRRPIMLSVTAKSTTPVTICQRKRPFVNINGVANSTSGGSGAVSADAIVASVSSQQTLSRKDRIPRPPNAFMLFANEYRKKLSCENPRESNKDISVRLGTMWKVMPKEKKDRYFDLARRVDEEHKRKYPHYVYNPKEARLRKAMRDQIRFRTQSSRAAVASGGGAGGGIGSGRPGGGGGGPAAQPTAPPPPPPQAQQKSMASPQLQAAKLKKGFVSPRPEELSFGVSDSLLEQQRSLQTQQAIRDQVESGLLHSYDDAFVEMGSTNAANGYPSVADLTAWYPLQMQAPDNGLRGWPSQFGSEHGDCLAASPQVSPYGQRLTHMLGDDPQQQLLQKPKLEQQPYVNLYPGPSAGYPDHIKENNIMPEDRAEGQDGVHEAVVENGPSMENKPVLENGTSSSTTAGTPTKLPGFQQAFGSTEIGRFSHEGFFSSQALELQVQTTSHGHPHSLHPNPSRRGLHCPVLPASSAPSATPSEAPKRFGARDGLLSSPEWPPLLFLTAGPGGPGDHALHHPSLLTGHYPDRPTGPPPPSMYSGGFGSPTFSPYGYYDYNLLNPVELMPLTRGPTSSGAANPTPESGPLPSSGSTPAQYTDLTELQPATQADYVFYSDRATDLTHLQPAASKQLQLQDSCRPGGAHPSSPSHGRECRNSPVSVKTERSSDDRTNNDQSGTSGEPDNAILRRMVLAEPIIISENERICVVLESNSASTNQFTSL